MKNPNRTSNLLEPLTLRLTPIPALTLTLTPNNVTLTTPTSVYEIDVTQLTVEADILTDLFLSLSFSYGDFFSDFP